MHSILIKQEIDSHENLYLTDDDISDEERLPVIQGKLNKWTNMLHGWQERFFYLKDGVLSYYKSKDDVHYGCRGSIRLQNAFVRPHEADDCRFEIRVGDSIWYLRGSSIYERKKWIEAIEQHRISESGYGSEQNLRRQNSYHSLNSAASLSIASASSFKRNHHLKEKLAEMETFKEILCRQVESLQNYFDTCSAIVRDSVYDKLERFLIDDHESDEHDSSLTNEYRIGLDTRQHNSSDGVSVSSESVGSETSMPMPTIIANGQIESANNGTIFEDARENMPEATVGLDLSVSEKASTPTKDNNTASQFTQPTRGFLSKFFPFRSNPPTGPPAPMQTSSTTNNPVNYKDVDCGQYEPTSRFEDLKKILKQHGGHALDFKGEAYTFKATTTGILTNLCYCIEIMQQREDSWRRRLDREIERRRKVEEFNRSLSQELAILQNQFMASKNSSGNSPNGVSSSVLTSVSRISSTISNANKMIMIGSPDMQEGPNCAIGEDEFFDAVDAQLDQMELEDERLEAFKYLHQSQAAQVEMPIEHPLYEEVQNVVKKHLIYCDPTAQELRIEDGWQIIAEEGEMRIYKKEVENDEGIVLDPLEIIHEVRGVTAREICHYFWDVKHRMEWEITVDEPPTVLEYCGEDTVVLHQVYKRVWPTTQRDSVYWSHIREIDNEQLASVCNIPPPNPAERPYNMWLVMNYSTDYKAPQHTSANQMIRLVLDVVLICQTIIEDEHGTPITADIDISTVPRERLKCKLLYASSVNPGGWAPASVLRTVARREYPRFIKRFSQYVIDQTANSQPNF